MTVPECRVYFRDYGQVEHSVVVNAVNRYHAFGLAMVKMRKCSWCNPDYREVRQLTIQLLEGKQRGKRLSVTREQFEAWLSVPPQEVKLNSPREYLLMLLGRIPESRDFKKGKSIR